MTSSTSSIAQSVPSEILPETQAEGDDGWQPVQRPRAAGLFGQQLKQRRGIIGRVYSYQKKIVDADMDAPAKNTHQNSRSYLLKKRAISHGGYADQHAANPSQETIYGRRIVRAVTNRVKSIPSNKNAATENLTTGKIFSSLESSSIATPNDIGALMNSTVSLGKSPSYKEVALAPPGTIAKLQALFPRKDGGEIDGKQEEGTTEVKENAGPMLTGEDNYEVKDANSWLGSTDHLKKELGTSEKEEGSHSFDNSSLVVHQTVPGHGSSVIEVNGQIQNSPPIDGMLNSIVHPQKEPQENGSSCEFECQGDSDTTLPAVEDLKDKPPVMSSGDSPIVPNQKLSASAAPFNPSTSIARAAQVSMSIPLPSGPGAVPAIAPWPVNVALHPEPASVLSAVNPMPSTHHPYPSPPPTPNMIQPLPFIYPPYIQASAVPSSNFPVTSTDFHPNHFSWQCNVNPHVAELIPTTVWPGCQPAEFSVPPPVVEPLVDPIVEPKVQFENSENQTPASILPVDIDNVDEGNKEGTEETNKLDGIGFDDVKENDHSNLCNVEISGNDSCQNESPKENIGSSSERKIDGEKTFSILIRGRRNRKQTLRMPINLLSRPYGSQSLKVIYNRVVRGSQKSTGLITGATH